MRPEGHSEKALWPPLPSRPSPLGGSGGQPEAHGIVY